MRIAAIYNQGIEERSSTFETRLRSVEEMRAAIGAIIRC
jgi:L-amino acid N-acyltransferase YncA